MALRNIGIFAHVDAGKTTLSEQMLLRAGVIRAAGSVDRGTAHTDDLEVERRRGISVRAKCVRLNWRDTEINLIDTPGHVDFTAEIERSLWAMDAAVLVVSAAEGVQPQTELLWHTLKENRVPTLVFVNKMDREGADRAGVLREMRRLLTERLVPMDDGEEYAEAVCALEDALTERYLEGDVPPEAELSACLRRQVAAGEAWPVFFGSALQGAGVEPVLDGVVSLLPPPGDREAPLCGIVFAIEQDRVMGRAAWVRMYSGRLANRDSVALPGRIDPLTGEAAAAGQKITQIRDVTGADRGELAAGEIGLIYGLGNVRAGTVLGDAAALPRDMAPGRLRTPLITVQVLPERPEEMDALRQACALLTDENPLLGMSWARQLGELRLQVMGEIQLEVLTEDLRERFGLNARFSAPSVIYRETIAKAAYGQVVYTMPKPCWAIMTFLIEPGERGSGVSYHSEVPVRKIMARYQHQVEQALPLALRQGRQGWPVTDVRITLVDGEHHLIHTHPLDFIVATPWGIQDGLRRGGSLLLEPVLEIRFRLPAESLGRVMSDIGTMRGEVLETRAEGERVHLTALVPAAECMDYPTRLAAATGGRGSMSFRLHGYQDCPPGRGCACPRRSVDPLDTSKYILAARSALEGGIFDLE